MYHSLVTDFVSPVAFRVVASSAARTKLGTLSKAFRNLTEVVCPPGMKDHNTANIYQPESVVFCSHPEASCNFSMTCSASARISNVCDLQISFILPTVYPVTYASLNWTCATVGVVITGVLGAWFAPKIGARHWYTGKSHTLESRHDVVSTNCIIICTLLSLYQLHSTFIFC